MGGDGVMRERFCSNGHPNRAEVAYCTTCGLPLPVAAVLEGAQDHEEGTVPRHPRAWAVPLAAILALLLVAGAAFGLGRRSGNDTPSGAGSASGAPSRSSSSTTATSAPRSTTTAPPTTSRPPTTTIAPATASDAARSAAVVYFTYGDSAKGYPSFQTVIAPSARPSVDSMIIGPDYRNASCSQIVESVREDPLPNPPTYGWDLTLRYQCPDGPPTSSADGTPLPMTENLYVEVTVAPSPAGGYWATQVQIVDNN